MVRTLIVNEGEFTCNQGVKMIEIIGSYDQDKKLVMDADCEF